MKLEKAIEILDDCNRGALLGISEETKTAIEMGKGAIQQIAQMRLLEISPIAELLPGETKEETKFKPDTTISTVGTGEGRML